MPVDQQLIDEAASGLEVAVQSRLKEGGQKTVLLVDRAGEQLVMKVISTGGTLPDALRRAKREVELLQSINHPNVVKVASDLIELGSTPDGVAWLEQHLDGEDLGDALKNLWDWPQTKEMAVDLARGLGALHAARVVHRDLNANNVRKLTAGGYVVMDPGYARHTAKSQLTPGGQPGTPGFLSPEHLQTYSGVPTASSDVFCAGILMHLALTGQLPIPYSGDLGDYSRRLAAVETDDVGATRTDLDQPVIALIRRCLHPQPARRFRDGLKLTEALEAI